jgi:hypothetical protein
VNIEPESAAERESLTALTSVLPLSRLVGTHDVEPMSFASATKRRSLESMCASSAFAIWIAGPDETSDQTE